MPEIKTVSKTTQKSSSKDGTEITEQTTEQSEEYAKKPETADFDTFSKRDGAVALQISAIYNLLPFFRGDYGESFRRPAFNLLKSAWQAMQQDSLKKLDGAHLSDEKRKKIFDELRQKAKSPMGVALTQVLLSLNRENKKLNLRDFPEMLPSICLAGMNFHLSGVDEIARNLSGLNLQGANFQNAILEEADLETATLIGAEFHKANLTEAKLKGADLRKANFQNACLVEADLQNANLSFANLKECDLKWEQLKYNEKLFSASITILDFVKSIYPDWKKENDPEWEALTEDKRMEAMQKFCNETEMLIFDEDGEQQIMLPL